MGYIDVNSVSYGLPDGRVLLDEISFRVGEGTKAALIGANGSGKTTLLRIIAGDLPAHGGAASRGGSLGVMRQFIAREGDQVRDLLLSVADPRIRQAAAAVDTAEAVLGSSTGTKAQMAYAASLADWGDAGGYDAEVLWDVCTTEALGVPFDRCERRTVDSLSGGEQKRLVLEALLRGPDQVLLLDEPDNYLDVPGKRWLEDRLLETPKTVLYISHDRQLLARTAMSVITVELGAAGNTSWVHPGGFDTYHQARTERFERFDEMRNRWDEERAKLRALVQMYKQKASYNSDMASRYRSARTRLGRFESMGPPPAQPRHQHLTMRLRGGRTGKRTVICADLELTGLMKPFDLEVRFGDRVAVLGSNGSGKSHFLRLLAAGGSAPEPEHEPVGDLPVEPVSHQGAARLGARVRPGWFAQVHRRPDLVGRTLVSILHRGDERREGLPREEASRVLARYELAAAAEQEFDSLSGGQQARFQILLLELGGTTLLLLDEPTDNLDLVSAEALQHALRGFEGTVLAVTHDRWFARDFDRFLVFGSDGTVHESSDPVWDEKRVVRRRG
ncbi:ATP-binding cassette domain-containing protein [Streptomyces anulatus]|uniref:ATP-binding cassette domain-containing protein n=1 Tax=Streptomyces anulatus TaxID=1892 RepID=UPI001C25CECB|nr:ATP-binding cassette domain-containing protein [Streptomyces anulatus]